MVRRYAVTGWNGQVVRSLRERASRHVEVEIIPLGKPLLDLSDIASIEQSLIVAKPDLIVSAAAYTDVDGAEAEEARAFSINAVAVGAIGKIAVKLGVPVIHLSTGYVFDGEKTLPYDERDATSPLGVYGRSKLHGENLLAASGADHAVLRTGWLYGPFSPNFLHRMLRLAESYDEVDVVADQYGNPTCALDVADGIFKVAENLLEERDSRLRGVFHMAGNGEASWADFADEIFRQSRLSRGPVAVVRRVSTTDYPTAARRPKNSRLDCRLLADVHGVQMPDWEKSTSDLVRRLMMQSRSAMRSIAIGESYRSVK